MIHFAIGTKAQFIKMAPLMHTLQKAGRPYHLLDLTQHAGLTGKILDDFHLTPEITRIGHRQDSVTTYAGAMRWLTQGLLITLRRRHSVRSRYFPGPDNGVVLIHGDTLSTLLGLYIAKAAGLPTAMVEAGLSSGSLLDPFPEEWIRHHVASAADYLYPPDVTSENRLRQQRVRGEIVRTPYNTGRDALHLMMRLQPGDKSDDTDTTNYGVATLHRVETITRTNRLVRAVRHIVGLSNELGPLRFYLHPPTENALKRAGLLAGLHAAENIKICGLASYPDFVRTLAAARFILTDGGSIQEEAHYLGKPCLLLRNRTERREGLGVNAALASWRIDTDRDRLLALEAGARTSEPAGEMVASNTILESLVRFQ